jgi:hypothetical protein
MDVVVGVVAEAGATEVPSRPARSAPVVAMVVKSVKRRRGDVRCAPDAVRDRWVLGWFVTSSP